MSPSSRLFAVACAGHVDLASTTCATVSAFRDSRPMAVWRNMRSYRVFSGLQIDSFCVTGSDTTPSFLSFDCAIAQSINHASSFIGGSGRVRW
jgi:hypothetical protein